MGISVDVLCLEAALLVKPVLQTNYVLGLFHTAQIFVIIEIIVTCNNVKLLEQRRCHGDVCAVGRVAAVLAAKIFGTDYDGAHVPIVGATTVDVGACGAVFCAERPTMTLVIVARVDVGGVNERTVGICQSVAVASLSRHYYFEYVGGQYFPSCREVLLVVAVFGIDALTIEECHFIVQMLVDDVAVHHYAKVSAVLNTVQRVRTATGKVCSGLRVDVDEFHLGWRIGIFESKRMFKLTHTEVHLSALERRKIEVILVDNTAEVVHKPEEPTVGNLCAAEYVGTLHIKGVGFREGRRAWYETVGSVDECLARIALVLLQIGVAALSVALHHKTFKQLIHKKWIFVRWAALATCAVLWRLRHGNHRQETEHCADDYSFHIIYN